LDYLGFKETDGITQPFVHPASGSELDADNGN
jgi:hypothetical protein